MKTVFLSCVAVLLGLSTSAQGQVVTSFYAPGPALTIPSSAVVPVTAPTVVGQIPMRRGLFGWRTENVPVFAAAPMVMAAPALPVATSSFPVTTLMSQAARPVVSTWPTVVVPQPSLGSQASFSSGAFAFPATAAPVPNAVIQSGFRGMTPTYSSGFAPLAIPVGPVFGVPVFGVPVNTFAPGSVMTMQ